MNWFKHGLPVTCEIYDTKIDDAKLCSIYGNWYICQNEMAGFEGLINKLGYTHSVFIGNNNIILLDYYGVTNLEPKYFIKEKCKKIKEILYVL